MNLAGCFLLLSSNQPTIERIDFPWCSHVDSSNANNTAIIKSNQYAYGCSHHQATSATYVHCISGQLVAVDIHYSNDIVEKCITTHNLLFTIECKRIIIKGEKKQRRHEINIINRYQRNRTTTKKNHLTLRMVACARSSLVRTHSNEPNVPHAMHAMMKYA